MAFEVAIIGQGYVGLPLSIATTKNGIKTVAYGNIVGLLIEAIKELKDQIKK
jgi:UDP-N-acetyl-D-mannosaminuronate dehydrogenase